MTDHLFLLYFTFFLQNEFSRHLLWIWRFEYVKNKCFSQWILNVENNKNKFSIWNTFKNLLYFPTHFNTCLHNVLKLSSTKIGNCVKFHCSMMNLFIILGEIPKNHDILREAYSLCYRLPVLNTPQFKEDFYNVSKL